MSEDTGRPAGTFEQIERTAKPLVYVVGLCAALLVAGWGAKGLLPSPDHAAALTAERRFTMLEAETKALGNRVDQQTTTLRELRDLLLRTRPPALPQNGVPWLQEAGEEPMVPAVLRR